MTLHPDPQQLVDHLFRREAGKMVSVLTKLFGLSNTETAQDIVQETLLAALHAWKLTLNHPISGEIIEAIAPIPDTLKTLLEVLRRR